MEVQHDDVKALREERFEKLHGRWRGFTDTVVARYLDCASPQCGFARLRCDACHGERLLLFSCRQRNICPSCDLSRRSLGEGGCQASRRLCGVLERRSLRGRATRESIKELMSAAAFEQDGFRPGMVSVVQTFGEAARFHPHVHTLCSRGGWNAAGQWVPVPYLDHRMAEQLFRHRVLRLVKRHQLLSDERIELLLSWTRSGFSADDSVRIPAGERKTLEQVARYVLRSPVSLSRTKWSPGSSHVLYAPKASPDDPRELFPQLETIDALEFLARVITQIPEPRRHLLFYYGHYANVVRGQRKISQSAEQTPPPNNEPQEDEPTLSPARKQALRRRWADWIRRVFELDPLLCPCGGSFRVVSFSTEPRIVRKILDHLNANANRERAPPTPSN